MCVVLTTDLSAQVYVRPAAEADMSSVLAIYNDAVLHTTASYDTEPRSLAQQQAVFSDRVSNGFPFFVAIDQRERVVGYSTYGAYRPRPGWRFAVEHSVYVDRDYRRQGIAALLLPPLIAHARRLGAHNMVGVVDAANAASIALHQRFGFEVFGVMKEGGFKFERWLDVAFMQKRL